MNNIASHNTMTYLSPAKWWMKIFNFVAKCQNKTLQKQLNLGIRNFDIRIDFDKHGNPRFAHGLIKYKVDDDKTGIYPYFDLLNSYGNCTVRIILEVSKYDKLVEKKTKWFIELVKYLVNKYKCIEFYGSNRKYDWKVLVPNINKTTIEYVQYVGSMDGLWIYKIYPRLYAMTHNIQVVGKYHPCITYIDFVGNYY